MRLPPRITTGELEILFSKGISKSGRLFRVVYLEGGDFGGKVSYLSPKSLGPSTQRNRARRLLKESFLSLRKCAKKDIAMAFVAKQILLKSSIEEISKEMAKLIWHMLENDSSQSLSSSPSLSIKHAFHQ